MKGLRYLLSLRPAAGDAKVIPLLMNACRSKVGRNDDADATWIETSSTILVSLHQEQHARSDSKDCQ